MKRYSLVVCLYILAEVTCRVTNQVKNPKNLTQGYVDNNAASKDLIEVIDKEEKVTEKSPLYLEDVLLLLEHKIWTVDEQQCVNHIHHMIQGLRNFTLWAVWEWDSQSTEPLGVLFGNKYQLGNYDQCMNPPWSDSQTDLLMKYCLVDIVLETDRKSYEVDTAFSPYQSASDFLRYQPPHARPLNELQWGVCMPASCPPSTIEKLLAAMVSRSHLGTSSINASIAITNACQTSGNHKEFDALFYYFVCTVGLLAVICLVCTFVSCSKQLNSNTTITQVTKAFCIKENASNLFKMRRDGLEAIYGVKWLTMCLIAVDHLISIVNSGPISDGYTSDRVVRSFFGLFLVHNDLFVDTFFFLSGLLTFSAFTTYEKLPNPFLIIFKRYIRLIVALAVVIFYVCAVHTYTGNGPLWNKLVDLEIELCRRNWWLNLLMINNYVDTENMCLIISWYIPCDFHFFVITVFWFSIYKKNPKAGLIAASVMFVIALSLPGIITYLYRLSAVQIFTIEFLVNPRGSHDLHVLYIKSHARYATYLVGVFFGFIFAKYKAEGKLNTVSKKWSVLFAIIASTLMLAVLVYGGTFIWREYRPLESAIYAALNRPAWAFGVGLLIMCCAFGQLPLINGILTWYPWVPVSRLTYGIYFTHTIIIARNVFITRNLQHNDYFKILVDGTGTIFWSCIFALLLWLLAEAPINKLIDICSRSLIRKGEKRALEVSEGNGNSQKNFKSIERDNFAKEENLSTNIQLDSKIYSKVTKLVKIMMKDSILWINRCERLNKVASSLSI